MEALVNIKCTAWDCIYFIKVEHTDSPQWGHCNLKHIRIIREFPAASDAPRVICQNYEYDKQ
ncbi:MAG: hypothetical protein GY861_03055 [bacterium]|nr:hypothetical protein [bacterium]